MKFQELRNPVGRNIYIMYTDLLTKIHNAQRAKKQSLKVQFSGMDLAIAEILVATGFIEAATKKGRLPKRIIEIEPKYENGVGAITGMKFLSVPSRRIYTGYKELRPVRQGYGLAVISTPQGILTAQQARKSKIGGQLLFEIW